MRKKSLLVRGAALFLLCAVPSAMLYAAIGSNVQVSGPPAASGSVDAKFVRPVSTMTDWATACSDAATTDNSGSTVVNPGSISRAEQHWVQSSGQCTKAKVRFKYPTAATTPTGPTVQVFGRDSNAVPERLLDDTATHELTLTVSTTNDARDATYSYTQPVEVDINANKELLVAVKTAQTGTGMTGAAILVSFK